MLGPLEPVRATLCHLGIISIKVPQARWAMIITFATLGTTSTLGTTGTLSIIGTFGIIDVLDTISTVLVGTLGNTATLRFVVTRL